MSETGGSLDFYFVAFFYGFFVYSNNLIKICNRYSLLLITFFFQTLTFQIGSAQSGLPIQPLKTLDLVKPNFESRYPSYQGIKIDVKITNNKYRTNLIKIADLFRPFGQYLHEKCSTSLGTLQVLNDIKLILNDSG